MFCAHCGNQIVENARFCNHCGQEQRPVPQQAPPSMQQSPPPYPQQQPSSPFQLQSSPYPQQQPLFGMQPAPYAPGMQPMQGMPFQPSPGLVGFSPRIQDPAYAKYAKSSTKYALVFAAILALVAVIGMPIYGNASGEIDFPNSLYAGMAIGGMFLVIALVQTLRKGTDSTWDGTVIDKKSISRIQNDDDSSIQRYYMQYRFTVEQVGGKKHTHTFNDLPALYNYYQEGDRVRHHKGFTYYEKYDKSRDSEILCAACLSMNPIGEDVCRRCKCPLLKC